MLTENSQKSFYDSLASDRSIAYFSILTDDEILIGIGGIVNIQHCNGIGEIALILDPNHRGKGLGELSMNLILNYGFGTIGLRNIFGESYKCSKSHQFWEGIIEKNGLDNVTLPEKKFYDGEFHDSVYFNFSSGIFDSKAIY